MKQLFSIDTILSAIILIVVFLLGLACGYYGKGVVL
jgi:hypothetical protein|nr:MAG TPA: hypothetical protein [Caudoviricetes sp.]